MNMQDSMQNLARPELPVPGRRQLPSEFGLRFCMGTGPRR